MGGRACIRGMRMTVSNILGQLAHGVTEDELLAEYPYLEREDIRQSLAYAAAPRATRCCSRSAGCGS